MSGNEDPVNEPNETTPLVSPSKHSVASSGSSSSSGRRRPLERQQPFEVHITIPSRGHPDSKETVL